MKQQENQALKRNGKRIWGAWEALESAREEGQVSCLNSLPFPFEGQGAKRAERWTGAYKGLQTSSRLLPRQSLCGAWPEATFPFITQGGGGGWLHLRSTVSCDHALLISFHSLIAAYLLCEPLDLNHITFHWQIYIVFIYFSRELKPVCLLANKYVPCKGHLISKITIKDSKTNYRT